MNWGSWSGFWNMGGYAFYVWGSYGITLILIILEILFLRARRRSAMRQKKSISNMIKIKVIP